MALEQVAFRGYARGQDQTGFGRWSWLQFRGKDDHRTRVYAAYHYGGKPQRGKTVRIKVYEQHERFLRGYPNEHLEPRDFFDKDIIEEIKELLHKTNIVLMIDANQNIMKGAF